MARTDPHFRLRIDPEIKQWIKKVAAQNFRSITAEINFALKERMEAEASEKQTAGHRA